MTAKFFPIRRPAHVALIGLAIGVAVTAAETARHSVPPGFGAAAQTGWASLPAPGWTESAFIR